MDNNKKSQPNQRTKRSWKLKHDPDFKRQVTLEYLESGRSARQIAAKYETVDFTPVAAWGRALKKELRMKASLNPSSVSVSKRKDVILDSTEYQELRRQLKTAKLRITGLETMIGIADEHFGVNIRKVWNQAVLRMRQGYPDIGLGRLCGLFGYTKGAAGDTACHHCKKGKGNQG